MGGPVVTFCPTRVLWANSKKMIHSSEVSESNLGILIAYFPEVESLRVGGQYTPKYQAHPFLV